MVVLERSVSLTPSDFKTLILLFAPYGVDAIPVWFALFDPERDASLKLVDP